MEASGHSRWFERMLRDLQFDLWIGDAAEIRRNGCASRRPIARMRGSCAAADRRPLPATLGAHAEHAICGNCCGIGIGWCRRDAVTDQLHVVALNEGLRRKKVLWRAAGRKELESIALAPWARHRRQDLLDLLTK